MKRFFSLVFVFAMVATVGADGVPHLFGQQPRTSKIAQPAVRNEIDAIPRIRRSAGEPSEDPILSMPNVIPGAPGSFIVVSPETNCASVKFVSIDAGLAVFPPRMLSTPTETVVTAATAGDYRLLAYAAAGGVATDPITTIVRVGNAPQPPPGPAPTPDPPEPIKVLGVGYYRLAPGLTATISGDTVSVVAANPAPGPSPAPPQPNPPVTANLQIVSIDNAAARNAATRDFLSIAYWQTVKAAGHSFWLSDSNNPTVAAKYKPHIDAAGGVPLVLIYDASGSLLASVPYPRDAKNQPAPTAAWMNTLIAKYGGKPPVAP